MSNDRHLYKESGAMGELLRRVTLASLGLDAMDDVSEQSFDVIGRADLFVERLLTGVNRVMPKGNVESMGLSDKTDAMLNKIFSGSQGPKRATDVGEWQYWLDAVLLMLFDEDEEDAQTFSAEASPALMSRRAAQLTKREVQREDIRSRIVAMKTSGLKPSAIQSLSSKQLRKLADVPAEALAQRLAEQFEQQDKQSKQISDTLSSILWGRTNGQSIDSFVTSKLETLNAESADPQTIKKSAAILSKLEARSLSHGQFGDVEEAIDELSKLGVLSSIQAEALRAQSLRIQKQRDAQRARQSFAVKSIQVNSSKLAARIMGSAEKMASLSQRAVTRQDKAETQHEDIVLYRAAMQLGEKLEGFNLAVQERILKDGESAATLKWTRAAGRFERFGGLNADTDRVMLRDMVESAMQLADEGFVTASHLKDVVRELSLAERVRTSEGFTKSKSQAVEIAETHHKQFDRLVSRVDHAINKLSTKLADIGFSAELSTMLGGGLRALKSQGQGALALQQMSVELDRFVARAIGELKESTGYDLITSQSDGVFVSQQDAEVAADSSLGYSALQRETAVQAAQAYASAMAQTVSAQREMSKLEISKQLLASQAGKKDAALGSQEAQEARRLALEVLASAQNSASLERIQSSIQDMLDAPSRQAFASSIQVLKHSEAQLLQVQKQVAAIENAARLSSGVRYTAEQNAKGLPIDAKSFESSFAAELSTQAPAKASVQLGRDVVNGEYLKTLGQSLEAYAKIRDGYQSGRLDLGLAGMSDVRLSRMLKLVTTEDDVVSEGSQTFDRLSRAGLTSFGYDEVVGSTMAWVRQIQEQDAYAATRLTGDLTAIFGAQKASQQHVLEMSTGKGYDASVLSSALAKAVAEKQGPTSIHSYSIDAQGEGVKVRVNAQASSAQQSGLSLRQSMGQSYMPYALRQTDASSPISAQIDIERLGSRDMVSGAESFISVILGAQATSDATEQGISGLERNVSMPGQGLSMKGYNAAIRSTGQEIGDILNAYKSNSRISAKIGGVEYSMTPDTFVQVLAKPSLDMAAMPSMTQGALYTGYTAMLGEYGEQRSLKALRKAYLETLAQSGAHTARASVGFNSQSFVSILGADVQSQSFAGLRGNDVTHHYQDVSSLDTASHVEASSTVIPQSNLIQGVDGTSQPSSFPASYSSAPESEFRWVTQSLNTEESSSSRDKRRARREHEGRHVLDRIDHLLDYVEDVSSRNVGVFSTNEAVRVLVEALPADSYLGERGLPKWRQKNAREQQAVEARALREALRKIGASPVQGTQRFADKRFVSPNLMPQSGTGAAPLFSGGSETGSTPSSSSATGRKAQPLDNTGIPDNDLMFIAEEVYQKIIDSLNEEIQRRRSE